MGFGGRAQRHDLGLKGRRARGGALYCGGRPTLKPVCQAVQGGGDFRGVNEGAHGVLSIDRRLHQDGVADQADGQAFDLKGLAWLDHDGLEVGVFGV